MFGLGIGGIGGTLSTFYRCCVAARNPTMVSAWLSFLLRSWVPFILMQLKKRKISKFLALVGKGSIDRRLIIVLNEVNSHPWSLIGLVLVWIFQPVPHSGHLAACFNQKVSPALIFMFLTAQPASPRAEVIPITKQILLSTEYWRGLAACHPSLFGADFKWSCFFLSILPLHCKTEFRCEDSSELPYCTTKFAQDQGVSVGPLA